MGGPGTLLKVGWKGGEKGEKNAPVGKKKESVGGGDGNEGGKKGEWFLAERPGPKYTIVREGKAACCGFRGGKKGRVWIVEWEKKGRVLRCPFSQYDSNPEAKTKNVWNQKKGVKGSPRDNPKKVGGTYTGRAWTDPK